MTPDLCFAIDIDGVACEHAKAICEYVSTRYAVGCSKEDVIDWDFDFGPITFVQAVKEAYPNAEFILGMEVSKKFKSFLSELRKRMGVVFATRRMEVCHEATREWVAKNCGEFEVVFVGHKGRVDAAFLIDDNLEDLLRFLESGGTGFLLKQPWNDKREICEKVNSLPRCFLVTSFQEVIEHVDDILQER